MTHPGRGAYFINKHYKPDYRHEVWLNDSELTFVQTVSGTWRWPDLTWREWTRVIWCVAAVRRVPPHFSMAPDSVEVLPGGSVNLTCVAVGSPMPTIRWRLGAVDLTPELDAPFGRNVLRLTDVRQTATYTCVASSELGSIEHQAEVQVKGTGTRLLFLR